MSACRRKWSATQTAARPSPRRIGLELILDRLLANPCEKFRRIDATLAQIPVSTASCEMSWSSPQ